MALSWNEIKSRAVAFSAEWANTSSEEADAKPFLDAFFDVFGINRRRVSANFEYKVKKLGEKDGYIDLLWKGMILVEMKSLGKDLDKALQQAKDYCHGLPDSELPQCILVCDFQRFRLVNLQAANDEAAVQTFVLADLVHHVTAFGFLLGFQKVNYQEQDPANAKAAEKMGQLHDRLKAIGYEGHALEVYLVRLLFCLFAEDTSIFERQLFQNFIEQRTAPDGSDLAAKLAELFQTLNTPPDKRFKNLDEDLAAFPYVNGRLFEEPLPMASFDTAMRLALLNCCYVDWSKISPAIFGAMFQSVMDPQARRNLGAHYTSEKNILKLIKPLFLDQLRAEFDRIKSQKTGQKAKLTQFHEKLSQLRFLDPACGCGNFLIMTYRELRLLELDVLKSLYKKGDSNLSLDISLELKIQVDQFYGIEYEEFPARIAEVAMWLIDHQMNMLISAEFGHYYVRLPLKKAANIVHGDALAVDWADIVQPNQLNYILGNPPFIGSKMMTAHQRQQVVEVFDGAKNSGTVDYVTAWYIKSAKYMKNTSIRAAFVSTNSICQGEQVSTLWYEMIERHQMGIHFAHRTFKWRNEAKGNAAVYCVIVGFAPQKVVETIKSKRLFDYETVQGEAHENLAANLNPYLVDAKNSFIHKKSSPICDVPAMNFGNMPLDGGHFLFTDEEKEAFILKEPKASLWLKPLISAKEFLNGEKRWCLWLVDAEPNLLKQCPEVLKRIANVKKFRNESVRKQTNEKATSPGLFGEIRDFGEVYIVIPRVTSENRTYIPIGFFYKNHIVGDTCLAIPNATLYHFGVLTSPMHMAWVKTVCGRLKSDFRYSKDIVYNNFPWPTALTDAQKAKIEKCAQAVLDARAQFKDSSLADLYHPLTMPVALIKAHQALDKVVDAAYRKAPFETEMQRLEFLFERYESLVANLLTTEKPAKKPRKKKEANMGD